VRVKVASLRSSTRELYAYSISFGLAIIALEPRNIEVATRILGKRLNSGDGRGSAFIKYYNLSTKEKFSNNYLL
jgi:hypothetical protein